MTRFSQMPDQRMRRAPPAAPRHARAFTILELLVVIGILATLLAILLPSLSSAREHARAAQCLTNLHHLAETATNYTSDFNDAFPIAQDGVNNWDITRTIDASGNAVSNPGTLFQFPGSGGVNLKLLACPDYFLTTNPSLFFTGYNYNTSYIGHGKGEAIVAPARDDQLMHPATTALFGDGQGGGPNKYMRAPALCNPPTDGGDGVDENTRAAGTQGYRHSGKTNVAWADGHTEAWQSKATQTAGPRHVQTVAKTGFLSADNSAYAIR